MRKLEIEEQHIMRISIQEEIARSEQSRYDHRLHAILLVSHGIDCYRVADLLGHHPSTVQRWVKRFNSRGFTGLYEGDHSGRTSRLTEDHVAAVEVDLRKQPREFGYEQNLWDGKLLSHHLRHQYGVKFGVRQCQRLFGKLGFRRRKPRPVIAKADPVAQATYKKTSLSGTR